MMPRLFPAFNVVVYAIDEEGDVEPGGRWELTPRRNGGKVGPIFGKIARDTGHGFSRKGKYHRSPSFLHSLTGL